jgi:hypothetical protein
VRKPNGVGDGSDRLGAGCVRRRTPQGAVRGSDEAKPSKMGTQIPEMNDVEALQALRPFAPATLSKPLDVERVLAPVAAGIRRTDA